MVVRHYHHRHLLQCGSRIRPVLAQVPRVRVTPRRVTDVVVRTRTLGFFDELARHADGGAVELRIPGERTWLLTDPAACRQALVERADIITRSSRYRRIQAILGHSLLTTDGADHHRRRRLIQPTFQPRHVREYVPAILAAADETARCWREGSVVRMEQEMAALTLSAIGRAVLGVDGREHAARVGDALDRLQRAIALTLVPGSERLIDSRVPVLTKLRTAIRELNDVAGVAAESDAPLVAALRELSASGEGLSQQDTRDELLTLLLAGHETTAGTLTWAWWFLDHNPSVADRVGAELAEVLGDRAPTYDDVTALPYTTAVVSETLRLRPAAWIIEREVAAPVDLAGLRPPVGTVLAVSPWILHRDPRSWSDPLSFVPDRWLGPDGAYDDSAPGQPRGAWLPFGAGSHVCVGAAFAWTEAVLVLATLAHRWRPTDSDPAMPMRAGATLRPGKPMLMRLHRRG
jgi:cytochrome P450